MILLPVALSASDRNDLPRGRECTNTRFELRAFRVSFLSC